ncbi:hypothetical protein MMC18_003119 [Xylographa bjoerkii]|nr:hypothetical protein [Xylographa bjoerkii]
MAENTATELGSEITTTTKGSNPRLVVTDIPAAQFASAIFEKAFKGSFTEATKGTIHLEAADPVAIELFICWLYRGASALTPAADDFVPLLRLYVLADMWCLPVLQNSIIDMIFDWFESKTPKRRLKAVKSIVEGRWDDIKALTAPTTAIIFITIELSKTPSIDVLDVYQLIELDDDFAVNFAKWHVFAWREIGTATLSREFGKEQLYL